MSRFRPTDDEVTSIANGLAANIGARVHVDVLVPRTQIPGKMRLAERDEVLSLKAATFALFKSKGLLDASGNVVMLAIDDWNNEIAARHLAVAVRDPADTSKPLAGLEDWRECDDDQIAGLWERYQDQRERLDPLAEDATIVLSNNDYAVMRDAVKKKELSVLMSFGSRKLASLLITSDAPPAP